MIKKWFSIFSAILLLQTIAYSQCFIQAFGELGTLQKTTGSRALDKWLNAIIREVQQEFYTFPSFYIYDDGFNVNAYSEWDSTANKGRVAFGRNLLLNHYDPNNPNTPLIIGLIIAHEYAHILQFQSHSPFEGKYRELHADFMAGFFLARQGKVSADNVKTLLSTFYKFGDHRFWDKNHHGTPAERSYMALAGFTCGQKEPSYINAYQAGGVCVEQHAARERKHKAELLRKKVVRPK